MKFFDLPVSLACRVLSEWIDMKSFVRLDTAARVSKEFSVPLRDVTDSSEFSIKAKADFSDDFMLEWLLARKIKVENVQLSGVMNEDELSRYLRRFGQFIRTAMFELKGDGQAIHLTAIHCRNLTSIYSVGGGEESNHVPSLCSLLSCNSNLAELRLRRLEHGDSELLGFISCPHLQRLSLIDSLITSFPWQNFVGPSLRRLHLEDLDEFTHADLITIGQLCTRLEGCAIRWMHIADATMQEFTSLCPSIVHFDMTGNSVLTDEGVKGVLQNLPNLRMLALRECFALTTIAWKHVAELCGDKLVDISVDVKSSNIGALADLLRTCPSIHSLQVDAEVPLTAVQMEPLFACFGQVCELFVYNTLVNDEVLCLVGKYCHELRKLTGTSIDDYLVVLGAAPSALLHGCPQLRVFSMDVPDLIPCSLRQMWNSIRPQLYFDDIPENLSYNICNFPVDAEQSVGTV